MDNHNGEHQPLDVPLEGSDPQVVQTATPGAMPVVAVRGLTKFFGSMCAVNQLNLDIPRGSMYGFVGPNGAGKTTTLSMITGLLRPDRGRVWVVGQEVWTDPLAIRSKIGILPDRLRLFDRLSGQELLTYTGLLHGMDKPTVASRSADLLNALGLQEDSRKAVADYSAGMTKKIGLACAVIHAPDLLVLDEPFEAIDPVSARSISEILGGFVRDGGTVILSSHVMETVEKLCDYVAVIAQGNLLAAGTVEQVAAGQDLESRFIDMVGGAQTHGELAWLRPSSV
jgi:ABC-2 type transport system ATP-binding protein